MRIAYLECFSGISGDMFLGALVDAGVPPEVFTRTVEALGVDARLEISRVDRSGISATKVDVIAAGEKELPREEFWEKAVSGQWSAVSHGHDSGPQAPGSPERAGVARTGVEMPSPAHDHEGHSHGHEHQHSHSHSHHDEHVRGRDHAGEGACGPEHTHTHSHRGLKEIRQIIHAAAISQSAKDRAIRIFAALGAAEAKVHNTDVEKIHFHEVGAIDAIVDIVCASVGAEALGVDEWICSPLNVGGGTVNCAHGTFPIPAPATLELLKDAPVYSGEIQKELVTPTGAAIVSVLAARFQKFPAMKAEKIAYGAGTRNFKGFPNVLRLTIGQIAAQEQTAFPMEEISVLEANVDDMTPQVFAYAVERVLQQGALDAFGTPVQMKKNRPGMLMTVLCRPEDSQRLTKTILAETTTLGVRMRREERAALARRHVNVSTRWGEVRMKLANLNGTVSNYAPEYEDCRRIAAEQNVPLKNVMQEAIRIYLERSND
jgi:pyridinium-3,5-bisthiocarboxylic acid mononucleotide nickel chelatase